MDVVFQRFLQKVIIKKMMNKSDLSLVQSARDDYCRNVDDSYDCWLLNPA